ncbi:GNAT family N-acetyltransferase [Myxococcota bacterium]|nr:GNAT family N-acetyltransferase [Myxococcota bacterium]
MADTARPLTRHDLDAVVRIDASHVGRARADFFQRRLAAAIARPDVHAQFGVEEPAGLAGYVLARVDAGEFGHTRAALRLQAIGVHREAQGHGVGAALMQALEGAARTLGAPELRTTAAWNDHTMLRFLDRHGFRMAENQIIDCAVHPGRLRAADEREDRDDDDGGDPDDHGLERDRVDVRLLSPADLPAITRIDRKLTGVDRAAYIGGKLDAALGESDIAVSLAAWEDGHVVGFLTARVDFGDAGRTESTAVLDTIGVDPDFAGRGVGLALMSQLFANLSALHVERIETIVSKADDALLRFLHGIGFGPSQRLAFSRSVAR